MIRFQTNQPGFANDMADVVRLFFGMEKVAQDTDGEPAALEIAHTYSEEGAFWVERCTLRGPDQPETQKEMRVEAVVSEDKLLVERLKKRSAKLCLYWLLRETLGFSPPWGSLTGIRPTKVARQLLDEGLDLPGAVESLQTLFDVSAQKAGLVGEILSAQKGIYRWGDDSQFDVYVGIPFCRTRCLYCSFFSADMKKPGVVRSYTSALLREIEAFGKLFREQGKTCRAIYVGGGTPVAIATNELRTILEALQKAFPEVGEFTVEAGRPDCVTAENMAVLHELGVGRVSINPQTMSDETLTVIGRGHTASDVLRAYALAREAGIPQINMDLIVGLPGEGLREVEATLAALAPLQMDNLTVHTLAVKHSSRLNERLADFPLASDTEASAMLDAAQRFALEKGMHPYYMYRQKYMAGNLENVGYALPGAECVYNVDMMEETHHIVALGAGAVSKRMYYAQTRHERYPNPKNIQYYIENIDRLIAGKAGFFRQP